LRWSVDKRFVLSPYERPCAFSQNDRIRIVGSDQGNRVKECVRNV
jgi:hypothetical protein